MSSDRETSKSYAVGLVESNEGSHFEFGETYHMALALQLDQEIKVFINSCEETKPSANNVADFFKLLGHTESHGRILKEIPPTKRDLATEKTQQLRAHLPETWHIFADAFGIPKKSKLDRVCPKTGVFF